MNCAGRVQQFNRKGFKDTYNEFRETSAAQYSLHWKMPWFGFHWILFFTFFFCKLLHFLFQGHPNKWRWKNRLSKLLEKLKPHHWNQAAVWNSHLSRSQFVYFSFLKAATFEEHRGHRVRQQSDSKDTFLSWNAKCRVTLQAKQSLTTAHSRWVYGFECVCVCNVTLGVYVNICVCACLRLSLCVSDYPSCSEINTSVCGDRPSTCLSLTHTHLHTQNQTVTGYVSGARSSSCHILNHSIHTLN